MEDRIKIGDVWYVKEDSLERGIKITEAKEELLLIMSREVMIETDEIVVEGSVLENEDDDRETFTMASVDITFKNSTREKEYWDNDAFLIGVAERNDDSMKEMDFDDDIDDKTKQVVIAVIDKMAMLGWI